MPKTTTKSQPAKQRKPRATSKVVKAVATAAVAVLGASTLTAAELKDKFLFGYQRAFADDQSLFLVGVFGRQSGKSHATGCLIAQDITSKDCREWMIAAPSERQSLESLEKVKRWLEAFSVAWEEEIVVLKDSDCKAACIKLDNGSKVYAVPGKPDTVRGFSCNVWLDEFAFFDNPEGTWRAILPSIANPLRGGKKRVVITSTPNGKAGKGQRLFDIVDQNLFNPRPNLKQKWSVHLVPLRDAIAQGLPVDYDVLAEGLGELARRQELDCEFLDGAAALLTLAHIVACESDMATFKCDLEATYNNRSDLRMGVDVGRVSDPSVIWTAERVGDLLVTREIHELKNTSHADQLEALRIRIRAVTRVAFDYTGMGIGMGDILVREFGEYNPAKHLFGKIQLCTFTTVLKRKIFPALRAAMDAPCKLRMPYSQALREDMLAYEQAFNGTDYSYEAPRTKDGHSDMCTAAALMIEASKGDAVTCSPHAYTSSTTVTTHRFSRRQRGGARKR